MVRDRNGTASPGNARAPVCGSVRMSSDLEGSSEAIWGLLGRRAGARCYMAATCWVHVTTAVCAQSEARKLVKSSL